MHCDNCDIGIHSNLYFEKHRIIPGCMGGTYTFTNVSYLTLEEHYVAHQLLAKIYPNNLSWHFSNCTSHFNQ